MEKEITKRDNIGNLVNKLKHGQLNRVAKAIANKCGVETGTVQSNWLAESKGFNTPEIYQDTAIGILQITIRSQEELERQIVNF